MNESKATKRNEGEARYVRNEKRQGGIGGAGLAGKGIH
jgi:hypothetical protein